MKLGRVKSVAGAVAAAVAVVAAATAGAAAVGGTKDQSRPQAS
jgi:type IV secretory pathway VirB2 component (pilin)